MAQCYRRREIDSHGHALYLAATSITYESA